MAEQFIEGSVYYPDWLPCPQLDTDLKPRERRYISDIGEVKKLRRFQSAFQATRQTIAFVFTPEQARDFQEWYKDSIIEGGAWFYADWPILHKETRIAYRFVTRPVWTFLALGNYHVSATVELYERKVGKVTNVYTSKIYPLYFSDNISSSQNIIEEGRMPPRFSSVDDITASKITIAEASMTKWVYSSYAFSDDITASKITIAEASMRKWVYSSYAFSDDITASHVFISDASARYEGKIVYSKFVDDINASQITIIAGETS